MWNYIHDGKTYVASVGMIGNVSCGTEAYVASVRQAFVATGARWIEKENLHRSGVAILIYFVCPCCMHSFAQLDDALQKIGYGRHRADGGIGIIIAYSSHNDKFNFHLHGALRNPSPEDLVNAARQLHAKRGPDPAKIANL